MCQCKHDLWKPKMGQYLSLRNNEQAHQSAFFENEEKKRHEMKTEFYIN